jgi:hypothetical protein
MQLSSLAMYVRPRSNKLKARADYLYEELALPPPAAASRSGQCLPSHAGAKSRKLLGKTKIIEHEMGSPRLRLAETANVCPATPERNPENYSGKPK